MAMEAAPESMWREYWGGSRQARDQLVEHYLPIALRMAKAAAERWPLADRDDMESAACEAVMRAVAKCRQEMLARFEGLLTTSVRYGILNVCIASVRSARIGLVSLNQDYGECSLCDTIRAGRRGPDRAALVESLAAGLDARRKQVVCLRLGQGLSRK
jgi:hypothetical protein